MTRRDVIRLGAATASGIVLARFATNATGSAEASFGGSPPVTPFERPLPIPPVLRPTRVDEHTDYYRIVMREAEAEIIPGLTTPIWGYDGMLPGPTIRPRRGRRIVVRQVNRLPVRTSVHFHGGDVPAHSDGHPNDLIRPGERKDYYYPNRQRAATYWYHDHAAHITAPNVYMGLAGFYLLRDPRERELNLPRGRYDVPLMIMDRLFNEDGSFFMPHEERFGVRGDTILVNGAVQPYFEVANRKYRLRLLNASNSTHYEFALSNGEPLVQIGTDGGLMPAPVARQSIPLFPAERADVIVDFATVPVGTSVILRNLAGGERTSEVIRFDVNREEIDDSSIPPGLVPLPPLAPADATRTFRLGFDEERQMWVINGRGFDRDRIDARPRRGDTEIWRFVNESGMPHPMHIHLVQFQILDRDGRQPSPGEIGLKDTVVVNPNEAVRVASRFGRFTGTYVFHCHNLQHEDHDMMAQFRVRRRRR